MYISAKKNFDFVQDLIKHQSSSNEFFSQELLFIIDKNLNIKNSLIVGYDNTATFSTWIDHSTILARNDSNHPYHYFCEKDRCAKLINDECTTNRVSETKASPKLYQSTKIISSDEYGSSDYANWLKMNLNSYYSIALPFGPNGCYHLCFYKTEEQSDFFEKELDVIQAIYTTIFQVYQSYEKQNELKLISKIKDDVIKFGDRAYIILDESLKPVSYNDVAISILSNILGIDEAHDLKLENLFNCMPFLIDVNEERDIVVKTVKEHRFRIQRNVHSNENNFPKIYYCISIQKPASDKPSSLLLNSDYTLFSGETMLTSRELEVTKLLCDGKSYQEIADSLYISYHTVKNHIQNIFVKLGVNNRYQLIKHFNFG
nr:LuxR C-terminal-related transcriptional regulator [Sedimentibacter sp.]